ncbi:MAG: YbaK/EbsC family protein [Pseudomonadota bacterium]
MPVSTEELLAAIEAAGINAQTVSHPPLFTVAESKDLRGQLEGGHTKNLFLRDKKGNVFLVVADEDADIDLKRIHTRIGASGRVSFGKPELLMELLGVVPGAVTAFGLVNDTEGRVTCVFDEALMRHDKLNCHPLTNTMTTTISRDDLIAFLGRYGHRPRIVVVSGHDTAPADSD